MSARRGGALILGWFKSRRGERPSRRAGSLAAHPNFVDAVWFEYSKLPSVNSGLALTFVRANPVGDGMFALTTETGQEPAASAFDAFGIPAATCHSSPSRDGEPTACAESCTRRAEINGVRALLTTPSQARWLW